MQNKADILIPLILLSNPDYFPEGGIDDVIDENMTSQRRQVT